MFEQLGIAFKPIVYYLNLMKKTVILLVLTVLVCFNVSAQASEELNLYYGDEISLNQYTLSYTSDYDGVFEVKIDRDGSNFLVEQISQEELFDLEKPHTFNVSKDLDIMLNSVESDSDGLYLDLELTASENIFADAKLESSAPSKVFVGQGDEMTIPLNLENTGIVNQTFSLSAEHNTSADVSYSFQEFNVTKLKINTDESESIDAKIDVPETARTGTYDIEFVAENKSRASESISLEIRESQEVNNERRIDLSSDQSYIGIKPGEQKEVSVRVRNSGNVMLDNVELNVEAPESWETEIGRNNVPGIEEYGSFRSIVTVEAPANAETGDKFLEISASSDETSTEEPERIRMTVQQESNLRYIGLGIMTLSLGGLVFVYRKLGRR